MKKKHELKEARADCVLAVYMARHEFAKRLRFIVPGAPDKMLFALADYDPEAKRLIRFWTRRKQYIERLLRHSHKT